jgi:hypothetical protein
LITCWKTTMDELALLRNLHRDTPGPSPAETAAARSRLLEAIDDPQYRTSRAKASRRVTSVIGAFGRRRLWAPVAAAAAVTAVAITAAVIAAPGPKAASSAPASGSGAASSMLRQAAAAAAAQPPAHGRYFATQTELIGMYGYPASGALHTQWVGNGDGGPIAAPFGQSLLTWTQFRRLPTAPGKLRAVIARASAESPGMPLAATEFSLIAGLLAETPASPVLRSALYQVAAGLPGLTLARHARDLIGRAATEVYVPLQNVILPYGNALYFNASTGAALDLSQSGQSPQCPDIWQDAVLASGYVSSEHQLPAGAVRTARPVPQLSTFPGCDVKPTVIPMPTPTSTPTPSGSQPATAVPTPSPTAVTPPTPTPTPTGTMIPSPTPTPTPSPSGTPIPTPTSALGPR